MNLKIITFILFNYIIIMITTYLFNSLIILITLYLFNHYYSVMF